MSLIIRIQINQDFNLFFPEIIKHIEQINLFVISLIMSVTVRFNEDSKLKLSMQIKII